MNQNFVMTPHRAKILTVLAQGDIVDPSGHATPELMKQTGHRTTNALAAVLLHLEQAGLITRDMNGRRTYRIALTSEGRRVAATLDGAAPAPTMLDGAWSAPGGVDLDLLAGVLLKKALIATQAQEGSAAAKEALVRAERAEARLNELVEELRQARNELAEQRAQIKTLEHNNTVLANQMDKVKKNPGTPIKDLISKREQQELEKLMRQMPAARG